MESFNTTTAPDPTNIVDEPKRGRKRKLKKMANNRHLYDRKTLSMENITMRGILYKGCQILERFKGIHTQYRDVESMKAAIDILNTGMVLRWIALLGEYNVDA